MPGRVKEGKSALSSGVLADFIGSRVDDANI
jgi:hypothetical protein